MRDQVGARQDVDGVHARYFFLPASRPGCGDAFLADF